jgi:hypothetical protein
MRGRVLTSSKIKANKEVSITSVMPMNANECEEGRKLYVIGHPVCVAMVRINNQRRRACTRRLFATNNGQERISPWQLF